MSDCPNVEMREALPELLHGRLDAALAASVREHVAVCADCLAELELLGRARRVYEAASAPVDTAAIVRALPVPAVAAMPRPRRAYSLGVLQLAAAVVLLLVGAFVVRTITSGQSENGSDPQQMAVQAIDSVRDTASGATPVPVKSAAAPRVLAMSLSDLDDLEADEIETMLAALDGIDAAPAAEPDTLLGSVRGIGSSEG